MAYHDKWSKKIYLSPHPAIHVSGLAGSAKVRIKSAYWTERGPSPSTLLEPKITNDLVHTAAIVSLQDRKCTWSVPFGTGPKSSDCCSYHSTRLSWGPFCWSLHITQKICNSRSDITHLFNPKNSPIFLPGLQTTSHNQTHKRSDAGNNLRSRLRQEFAQDFLFLEVVSRKKLATRCLWIDVYIGKKKKTIWRREPLLSEAMLADVLMQVYDSFPCTLPCPVSCSFIRSRSSSK